MSSSIGNIKIEPVNVDWSIEEQWQVSTVADVSSNLQNKYFFIYSGSDAKFHVWINVATLGVDPAPANSTGIPVAISANASAAAVATAVQAAVDANANFTATVSGHEVVITADVAGESTDWADFNTGFTLTQCQDGGATPLGFCQGDIEVKFEETLAPITAHQRGTSILAELRQGVVADVSMTLQECDPVTLKAIFAKSSGGVHTPGGGTEVFGVGSSRQGQNTIVQARRLNLHPVVLSSSNYTRDLTFWKAYPLPDTLVFSGENPQTLTVSFKTYLDDGKPEQISQWVFGDYTQYVPVYP